MIVLFQLYVKISIDCLQLYFQKFKLKIYNYILPKNLKLNDYKYNFLPLYTKILFENGVNILACYIL